MTNRFIFAVKLLIKRFKLKKKYQFKKCLKMFYDDSFTKQPQDYLTTFIKNRIQDKLQDSHDGNELDESSKDGENNMTHYFKRNFSGMYSQNNDHDLHENQYDRSRDVDIENEGHHNYNQSDNSQIQHERGGNCDDSFLDLVDRHLSNLKREGEKQSTSMKKDIVSQETVSISKQQISHCLLQNQSTRDSVQLTNLLPVKSIAKVINAPFEFRLFHARNKFIKKEEIEILLQPYESVEIQFEIKKRESEIGNIYETLRIDTFQILDQRKGQRHQCGSKFLKFEITFVKPKLQVNFLGKTTVKRIQEHKIAHLQIYPNELNQYFINLIFSQQQFSTLTSSKLNRIECQIQVKGYIQVHQNSLIIYENEPIKITLRKLTHVSGAGKTSVIIIRPLNSSLTYVLGIKCMDRKNISPEEQQIVKINKISF